MFPEVDKTKNVCHIQLQRKIMLSTFKTASELQWLKGISVHNNWILMQLVVTTRQLTVTITMSEYKLQYGLSKNHGIQTRSLPYSCIRSKFVTSCTRLYEFSFFHPLCKIPKVTKNQYGHYSITRYRLSFFCSCFLLLAWQWHQWDKNPL